MRPVKPFRCIQKPVIGLSLIALSLLSSFSLNAQAPADFSGKWEFDKTRSDKEETGDASFNGTIILEINQGADLITFTSTYFIPGKDGIVMRPDSFLLDGRVTTDNGGTGPARKSVKWSADKKILTTSSVMTDAIDGVKQDFLTAMAYRLSGDRETLFIDEFYKSRLNGEKTVKKVYRKKT
jgi:hypothetical protein